MSDLTQQVDALFSPWDKTTSPGCALAVIWDGQMVYRRGYGMASLELNVPITPSSIFYLASVSKQFAAMAIALLIETGQIALSDDIRRYLPELPDYGTPVTVEHLIRHTSGIRDYLELGFVAGQWLEDVWTEAAALKALASQSELNFRPGDEYVYSNSGYILLSIIVRRITGRSLRRFADEEIFQPLGMIHTTFKDHHQQLIPNRVSGYSRGPDGGFVNEYHNLQLVGDGGLYSSAEDLYYWDQNFYNNQLGRQSRTLLDLAHTTRPLNDGTPQDYAFGLELATHRGLKIVRHGGGLNGARTQMVRFPEQRFTAICLSNLSEFNPNEMIFKVADLYLADVLQPVEAAEVDTTIELPESALADMVGLYRNAQTGLLRRIELREGKLVIPFSADWVQTLLPLAQDRFKLVGSTTEVRFEAAPSGGWQMTEQAGTGRPIRYTAVEAARPSPDDLAGYCGRYRSAELETDYLVEIEDGQLVLKHRRNASRLEPTMVDGFHGNGTEFVFRRGEDNMVVGLSMYNSRLRNIRFSRIAANTR